MAAVSSVLYRLPWSDVPGDIPAVQKAADLARDLKENKQESAEWKKLLSTIHKLVPKGPWKHLFALLKTSLPVALEQTTGNEVLPELWQSALDAVTKTSKVPRIVTAKAGKTVREPSKKSSDIVQKLLDIIQKHKPMTSDA